MLCLMFVLSPYCPSFDLWFLSTLLVSSEHTGLSTVYGLMVVRFYKLVGQSSITGLWLSLAYWTIDNINSERCVNSINIWGDQQYKVNHWMILMTMSRYQYICMDCMNMLGFQKYIDNRWLVLMNSLGYQQLCKYKRVKLSSKRLALFSV